MQGDEKLQQYLKSASIWMSPGKARKVALIVCEFYARSGIISTDVMRFDRDADVVQIRKWFDEIAHRLRHMEEYENRELERQEQEDRTGG